MLSNLEALKLNVAGEAFSKFAKPEAVRSLEMPMYFIEDDGEPFLDIALYTKEEARNPENDMPEGHYISIWNHETTEEFTTGNLSEAIDEVLKKL